MLHSTPLKPGRKHLNSIPTQYRMFRMLEYNFSLLLGGWMLRRFRLFRFFFPTELYPSPSFVFASVFGVPAWRY